MLEENITMFENIYELESSHYFTLNLSTNAFERKRYYELQFLKKYEKFNEARSKKYIDEVKDRIFKCSEIKIEI
jgi:asparagine synthetase B (glutamine-hydrolysing)